jgi:hypothetical protein
MKRMKIALFSPLNPVKTGISDYTEEMLFEMKKHVDIDLVINQGYEPQNEKIRAQFKILTYDSQSFDPSVYDEILYHMGNNYQAHGYIYDALKKFPGIVVLHDYVLQGFYAEKYDADRDFDAYLRIQKKYYREEGEKIAENLIRRTDFPIWERAAAFDYRPLGFREEQDQGTDSKTGEEDQPSWARAQILRSPSVEGDDGSWTARYFDNIDRFYQQKQTIGSHPFRSRRNGASARLLCDCRWRQGRASQKLSGTEKTEGDRQKVPPP